MENKLPNWLLISIGVVSFLSLGFLLIWLASTGTIKYEESQKDIAPIHTQQQGAGYRSLLEKNNEKIKTLQSHETLLQDQKEKELNQTRWDTKDRLQLMSTQKKLSDI
ncbi:hypothetical protein BU251_03475 [Candidatus Velamenicoccus archaeovorus]|uniref:Uncharacterized protein n=1 Tax=Velamenicoccus archaeovorus TaxID=1930593 RepID=A0A410P3W4_VELA1|nr:hypothetical protein [Candidatus Velamenicoccus archaeovorus]QAT16859.1 hypothetical protein BU251_03475 [Candidatus Velamenicoccus archaeovorus]